MADTNVRTCRVVDHEKTGKSPRTFAISRRNAGNFLLG
jgi:hypothetical protein